MPTCEWSVMWCDLACRRVCGKQESKRCESRRYHVSCSAQSTDLFVCFDRYRPMVTKSKALTCLRECPSDVLASLFHTDRGCWKHVGGSPEPRRCCASAPVGDRGTRWEGSNPELRVARPCSPAVLIENEPRTLGTLDALTSAFGVCEQVARMV